jgi:hypothetical protein
MTRKPNFRRQIRNILLGFALLGLMVIITVNVGGFYWLTSISHQKYYPIVMLGVWCGTTYLLFNDKFPKNISTPRKIRLLAYGRYLTVPVLSFLLLCYMGLILIAVAMPMVGYKHCDTLQTPTAVYHLDLLKGLDLNYRITRCNQWQMWCQVIAQSVDEDVLDGETLHIEDGAIFATAANRPDELITWSYEPDKQRSFQPVDRLPIEKP